MAARLYLNRYVNSGVINGALVRVSSSLSSSGANEIRCVRNVSTYVMVSMKPSLLVSWSRAVARGEGYLVSMSGLNQSKKNMVTITKTSSSTNSSSMDDTNNNHDQMEGLPSLNENNSYITDDIIITKSCIQQIQKLAKKKGNPDSMYLRVAVDPGGCSGFQYSFELESKHHPDGEDQTTTTIDPEDDMIYQPQAGVTVVVDKASLDLIRGSTVDFVQEMIRSSFAIIGNPQSESACGCGSSFAVKNFSQNPAQD